MQVEEWEVQEVEQEVENQVEEYQVEQVEVEVEQEVDEGGGCDRRQAQE